MKWKPIELYRKEDTDGTDKLGNTLYKDVFVKKAYGIISPESTTDLMLHGRTVSCRERKFVIRIPFKTFPQNISMLREKGMYYDVSQILDYGRFTVVYAVNRKGETDRGMAYV